MKTLLLLDLQATELGVTLCNLAGGLDESSDVLQVLKDCFAKKATATILKRTGSFWALAGWLLENEQTAIWNVNEPQLYRFMCSLRDQQSAPTKASHVIESINFFDTALRFRNTDCKTLLSARVTGAAHSMFLGKRKLKQAPQLSVRAVKILETICLSKTNLLRTIVSGALLFCTFSAARWSDFARLEDMWIDKKGRTVLVEAETSKHKTSRSKESKTRLLPFTAIGRFSHDAAWGEPFVEAWHAVRAINQCNYVPSWNDQHGTWGTSPMSTAEASLHLQELLDPVFGQEALKWTSHSCKATILTWCGMTNVMTREERTMLGHHVEPTTKAATTYNRDSQLLLQAKVNTVLKMVLSGELDPDSSRASRLDHMINVDEEAAEPERSDESDCEWLDEAPIYSKVHLGESLGRPEVPLGGPDEYKYVAHKLTGTVHIIQEEDSDRLACGRRRMINMTDVEPAALDAATAPFCIQCNSVIKDKQ